MPSAGHRTVRWIRWIQSRRCPTSSRSRRPVDVDGEPALIGGRCRECQSVCFPVQDVCPYCSEESIHGIRLSRTGTLWAWTAVTAAPPGYEGPVPYGFGVVELAEGVRMITRLTEVRPGKAQSGSGDGARLDPLVEDEERRVLTLRVRHRSEPDEPHACWSLASGCTRSAGSNKCHHDRHRRRCGEAGVRRREDRRGGFQAAFSATAYGGVASGHKVLGRLGMTGMPIVDVEAGCA